MSNKIIYTLLVIAVASVVGMVVYKKSGEIKTPSPEYKKINTNSNGTSTPETTSSTSATSTEETALEIEETALDSTDERGGTATATRSYASGAYAHSVTADVSDPQEGKFYEGWLVVKGAEPRDFFSTGKMTKQSDGTWELKYTSTEDRSRYSFVVITEETEADGLDGVPETHIFEGSFN